MPELPELVVRKTCPSRPAPWEFIIRERALANSHPRNLPWSSSIRSAVEDPRLEQQDGTQAAGVAGASSEGPAGSEDGTSARDVGEERADARLERKDGSQVAALLARLPRARQAPRTARRLAMWGRREQIHA